jgi:hypothetical protein
MNCQNFESRVNELARQQMMEANAREQALAHTEECAVCALRLADERALTQKLRDVTTEMSGLEAPARIEGELLAAFRKQSFTEPMRSAKSNWRYWASAIAAAVLLAVIGIAAMSTRPRTAPLAGQNPDISPLGPANANLNKGPELPVTAGGEKPAMLPSKGTTLASYKPRRHANPLAARSNAPDSRTNKDALVANNDLTVAANHGNEIATDFMPVGYANPLSLEDGGQVMRVELPRSALAGFGLPVNMDRVNERVKADVLVGTDGQAKAIRFIQ